MRDGIAVRLHCDASTFPYRQTHPIEEMWIALVTVDEKTYRGEALTPAGAAIQLAEKLAVALRDMAAVLDDEEE